MLMKVNEKFRKMIRQRCVGYKYRVGNSFLFITVDGIFRMYKIIGIVDDILIVGKHEFSSVPKRFLEFGVGVLLVHEGVKRLGLAHEPLIKHEHK